MADKFCYNCGEFTFCQSCEVPPPTTPLVWTDAKPTVPGWYYFRTDADCEPTISHYDPKNWFGREWMAQLDGQFAGPIPQPEEPR